MTVTDLGPSPRWRLKSGVVVTALRYGVSAAGPVAVSGAHFFASLIFLRNLPAREFGLLSFAMVVVSFGMSLNGSLISMPITRNLAMADGAIRPVCFQMNWLVCALFAGLLCTALLLEGAPRAEAAMLGLFGGAFAYRWFSRCLAFVDNRMAAAIRSDFVYSMALVAGLGALAFTHHMDFTTASEMLLAAALLALFPFGAGFFKTQIAALGGNPLRYWPIFRDLTRWSLLGVALTEITVNAHAYLVTFISGPSAFALLALGMLLFRPASLMLSALPDMERPVMARAMAAKDMAMVARVQRHFGHGLAAAWGVNLLLCAGLLAFFPILVLKKGYALDEVILVAGLSAIIMALRAWRMPLAVLLQAAGRFKDLAGISTTSGAVSVAATLTLLLTLGPVASLIGIVLGELVILVHVRRMVHAWWAEHA